MWNKKDEEATSVQPVAPAPPSHPAPKPPRTSSASSTIGPSLAISGELTGEENLVINGSVEGKVDLRKNSVTVGRQGRVKADIYGESITVEGQVHGNLYGRKDVVLRESGSVRGNIVAPRVVLENGSKFKGSIDMEPDEAAPPAQPAAKAAPAKSPQAPAAPKSGGSAKAAPATDSKTGQIGLSTAQRSSRS